MTYYFWLGGAACDFHTREMLEELYAWCQAHDATACPCGCGALDGAH